MRRVALTVGASRKIGLSDLQMNRPNQSMKPTTPFRYNFTLFAATPCRGLSLSRWMLSVTTCAIAASMVLLVSCSVFQPVIDVIPIGSLQQGVVFYLGDLFRPHPEFTVTGVTVQERQSDGSRRAVWITEGAQPLRYITYGAKYPGLMEARRPLPLKRGNRYEVFVYTSTGGKGLDLFEFQVDENGNVRQVPDWGI